MQTQNLRQRMEALGVRFIDALENGNFRFAYEIALERNYRELPLLEKLKD